jgi:choline dehydrogenase
VIERPDVVVAGGGSAGVVLAVRLSEDPTRQVLLIEAGGSDGLGGDGDSLMNVSFALTTRDWGYRARAIGERTLDYPQGRFVGGGSSVNAALALRGAPEDFDRWAEWGNPSWSWAHMLPCFRRLESDEDFGDLDHHGETGPIPVVRYPEDDLLDIQLAFRDGCFAHGMPWVEDHNAPESTGIGRLPMNRRGNLRVSTALGYLQPAASRPNLHVLTNAEVRRVRTAAGRVVGVEVATPDGVADIDAGEVVISSGSIGSPMLLWRSGIGPANELRALGLDVVLDSPQVGSGLTDHPGAFLFLAPGELTVGPPDPQFQIGARYTSSGSDDANDMLLSMMNFWDLTGSPDFRAAVGGHASVVVLTCGVHLPRSRGRVRMVARGDGSHAVDIDLGLLRDDHDVARLVEGLRHTHAIATSGAMDDYVGEPLLLAPGMIDDDAAMAAYARDLVAPWYHPVSTCAMGPDEESSVVDDQLRVHGIEGLRVVDASVMPHIVRAPTNLTTIAIGERAAELMRS